MVCAIYSDERKKQNGEREAVLAPHSVFILYAKDVGGNLYTDCIPIMMNPDLHSACKGMTWNGARIYFGETEREKRKITEAIKTLINQ